MRVYKVLVVGVCVVLGTSAIDAQRRGRRPRGPEASPVLEAVTALAQSHGFADPIVAAMPANNLSLVFKKRL
mgnify:CR=1 FL=1